MGKQWVRQQVRRNEVQDAIDSTILWLSKNRQTAAASTGGAVLILIIFGIILYRSQSLKAEAWSRLTVAQTYAYMGRSDQSLEQLQKLSQDYGNTDASGYASLFAGDVLYRLGNYPKALEAYARVLELGPESIQPMALVNTAVAHEAAGQYDQAVANGRSFLDAHSDHFLAPQAHSSLARSLALMGRKEEARVALQKMTLQYPDTPWANWAKDRLGGK